MQHKINKTIIAIIVLLIAANFTSAQTSDLPPPDLANVKYGEHERNVMDIWFADTTITTPLLIFIHGGGFIGGDKSFISSALIENMKQEGISVASINYRLTETGLFAEGENRYPAPMHDGARAVQFLRYNASKYKLDKNKFAATGGSAGGCMLMWLGFHPDLAQLDHQDPVLRESSRLQALAPRGGQTCVHGPTLLNWFGVNSLNLGRKEGEIIPSSEQTLSAENDSLSLDASPITHLTPDDPSIYLFYNGPNEAVNEETLWGTWIHHPVMGIKLKEAMETYLGMECHLEYADGPPVTEYESQQDFIIHKLKSLPKDTMKWETTGFKQANTMGGGEAPISQSGKFRVFVLMGQSNMQGAGLASELEAPYNEKHERIRIWANGRWEYFVPSMRFGPGVSFAHQLADFWPDDNIGIIKVAVGGTGICGFEKDWSYERAQLTFDGDKGPLYQDLMNAVAEAKLISQPEFCGFFWKQGAADGTKKVLANEYYNRFQQLISDLQADLGVPDLPTFVPVYMNDSELLNALLANLNDEDLRNAESSASKPPENDEELLMAILSYINDLSWSEAKRLGGSRPYLGTVINAQNRAGWDIPGVTAIYPGRLPIGADGTHYSSEGYITLGKVTASAVEEFYLGIDTSPLEAAIQQAQTEVNAQAENIGDGLGQYTQATFDAATNAIAVAGEALGNDLTKSGLDYALNTLAGQMELFVPVTSTAIRQSNRPIFGIYLNPSSGTLHITADNAANYSIFDINGRLLMNRTLNSNTIDVSTLINGIYLIQIKMTDNSVGTTKFVK